MSDFNQYIMNETVNRSQEIIRLKDENARLKQELSDTIKECTRLRKGWSSCHKKMIKVSRGVVAIYVDTKTYQEAYHLAQEILKELSEEEK